MESADLPFGSLRAAADALHKRKVSAAELCENMLSRIAALNPRFNAITDVIADTARYEADAIDRRRQQGFKLGPLAGIPISIKDIIDTVPAACSAGLDFLRDRRPNKDAPAVTQLRQAGAVVTSVTATDPGAFGVRTGAVTHPQAPSLTVGGSSGGSGGALAAGLTYAALGTDTGGSIRIPAACCQIAGLMPTFDRISTDGAMPLSWSADHIGPMARSVSDLALVAPALGLGVVRRRRTRSPVIIGHAPAYWRHADPEVKEGMQRALDAARETGAEIREVAIPSADEALAFHVVILGAEAAAYHLHTYPDRLDEYPPGPRRVLTQSQAFRAHDYIWAIRQRDDAAARVNALFKEADFLMLPTLAVLPPPRDSETVSMGGQALDFTLALIFYTCLFDHTGNPVLSMPASVIGPGIGTSVQIVGPRNNDAEVLSFGMELERALALKIDYTIRA